MWLGSQAVDCARPVANHTSQGRCGVLRRRCAPTFLKRRGLRPDGSPAFGATSLSLQPAPVVSTGTPLAWRGSGPRAKVAVSGVHAGR